MQRLSRLSLRINPIFAAFLLIAFLSGIAGALLTPTLSLFLTTEVKVRPLWVGLFYTANAVAGIVVSFLLAKRSDTRGDRRRLILLCCLMAVGNCLLFAFNRDYLTLITAGVLMSAVANTAMPQIFALAREYADSEAREVVMFSSVMRAQLSLAWVIGPVCVGAELRIHRDVPDCRRHLRGLRAAGGVYAAFGAARGGK